MAELQVKGASYALTPDYRLVDMGNWSKAAAMVLAEMDGLFLTEGHWEVISFLRDFYHEYNISPVRKLLKKGLAERYGPDKAADAYLAKLFPRDVLVQGTRIAGLPMPMLDAELEPSRHIKAAASEGGKRFNTEFKFDGKVYKVYPSGNLTDPSAWSERLAEFIAAREGVSLTEEHWEVLNYLRKFYFQYGITPMVKLLMRDMREHFGPGKSSKEHLYSLFPEGPSRQGSRIAGLPSPQGCIDP